MKQIKFRAWDTLGEIMINYQVHGMQPYIKFNGSLVEILRDGDEEPIKNYILMQFTGLLDKNGKEIYEGDIVRYKETSGFSCEDDDYKEHGREMKPTVVEFKDGAFSPREYYNYCEDGFYAWRVFDFEIIGNKYENPELLHD